LLWGVSLGAAGFSIKLFFLVCVVVAGVFGAATVNRRILFVQALPAAIAAVLTVTARS
jgi:putative membrane protein